MVNADCAVPTKQVAAVWASAKDTAVAGIVWNESMADTVLSIQFALLSQRAPAEVADVKSCARATEANTVDLSVLNMNGTQMAVLQCTPDDLVSEAKRRLSRSAGTAVCEQRLVYGNSILKDHEKLWQCGITGGNATVHCIRVRPSGVARNLETRSQSDDPEEAMQASLAEVADSVLQDEFALSEKVRPEAANVLRAVTASQRGELINWMVQAFEVLNFDDHILHSVVLTLDRYYARRMVPIEVGKIQSILLSAVCTEMKLAGEHDFPRLHWQRVLRHLSHGRVSIASILQTEFEVLSVLQFSVGVPTPMTFLQELGVHLREQLKAHERDQALQLALFLLELALFEPEVQYRYPHAVLAIGALRTALHMLGVSDELQEALFENLSAYGPGLGHLVPCCEQDLLDLWLACSSEKRTPGDFHTQLLAKFDSPSRCSVARLSPQAAGELKEQRRRTSDVPKKEP